MLDVDDLTELGMSHTSADIPSSGDTASGVLSLHAGRVLPTDTRPPPSVAIYDQLLRHRKDTTA
ncbi:hypothetical protein GCM10025762_12680 [Haloechinothrix salitolerans]